MSIQARIRQNPLPFWTTSDSITYTELKEKRRREYHQAAPELLLKTEKNLHLYRATACLKYLQEVNCAVEILLELEPSWLDFSVHVVEAIMSPGRPVMSANDLLRRFEEIRHVF